MTDPDRAQDGIGATRRAPDPAVKTQRALPRSRPARAAALTLAVVLDALAIATVLRPHHGFRSEGALLAALAIGAGAALVTVGLVAIAAAILHRRTSAWEVATRLPTLGLVVAAFVLAGTASQVVPALHGAAGQASATTASRAAFERWQSAVVPIVVGWMHAIRADRVFIHDPPLSALPGMQSRVRESRRSLEKLVTAVAAASHELPRRSALRRLTYELNTAIAVARRAQRAYDLALTLATSSRVPGSRSASAAHALIRRANMEIRDASSIMTTFSYDANALGGRLFANGP